MINAVVPVSFTVDADSEEEAVLKATTLKQYCMTSPDGERIEVSEEDISSVEEADIT